MEYLNNFLTKLSFINIPKQNTCAIERYTIDSVHSGNDQYIDQ